MSPRTRWSPPEQKASGPSPVSTITPTEVSSRARSSASEISISVWGRNALRTSGLSIVILAIPSASLVADVLVARRRPASRPPARSSAPPARGSSPWRPWRRRTISPLEEWLTAAARSRPDHPAVVGADGTLTYAQLDAEAHAVGAPARGAGGGAGRTRGHHAAARLRVRHAAARRAADRRGAGAAEHPPARAPSSAARPWPARADAVVDRPLDGLAAEVEPAAELDPAAIHAVLFTSGTTGEPKPVELTVGNQDAPPRHRPRRWARSRAIAGCARCRCSTSPGWRSWCAARAPPRRPCCTPDSTLDAVTRELADGHATWSRWCRPSCGACAAPDWSRHPACARCCSAAVPSRPTCSSGPSSRGCRRAAPTG